MARLRTRSLARVRWDDALITTDEYLCGQDRCACGHRKPRMVKRCGRCQANRDIWPRFVIRLIDWLRSA